MATIQTRKCLNPACRMSFIPDKAHRFGGCCSADCARAMTSRSVEASQIHIKGYLSVNGSSFVPMNRRHGVDRKGETE